MPRILGIDFGQKRTGIAVTDPLQIAVHPLKTVATSELLQTLLDYTKEEEVELIVFGLPTLSDGNPTYLVEHIHTFIERLKKQNQTIKVDFQEESYSSKEAKEIILKSGVSKKQRRDKSKVDLISAIIILQRYLNHIP